VYSTILKINYVVEELSAPFFRAEFTEQLATSQLGITVVMVIALMGDAGYCRTLFGSIFWGWGWVGIIWSNKICHMFIT